jgi:hypothetical protein
MDKFYKATILNSAFKSLHRNVCTEWDIYKDWLTIIDLREVADNLKKG